jgi:UDP-glucuronate decarboxylase
MAALRSHAYPRLRLPEFLQWTEDLDGLRLESALDGKDGMTNSVQSFDSGKSAGRDSRSGAALRVLVTGGAGFVGSHLVARLLAGGCHVICLDNLQTGSRQNLSPFAGHPAFAFVEHDVIQPYTFDVDRIYNLACPASPPLYQRDPVHTFKTSVIGALHALDLARATGARVLQASTSEVYGEPLVHPQPESYWGNVNPVGLRSCYDEGKRGAETLFSDYRSQYGVDARIARIFNTYGPRMQPGDGRVVSNFVVQALTGRDLTIYGDGRQTRSFCYIDDLVEGLVRLMEHESLAGPVNLGNPEEFTIRELATLVIAKTGTPSRIVQRPLPSDDPTQRRPDITLAKASLGWLPATQLHDGLERTIAHFRAVLAEGTAFALEAAQ